MRSSSIARWVDRWWRGEAGFGGRAANLAMYPAEMGFAAASNIRNAAYELGVLRSSQAPVPVISVGNLVVGGAGKTPFAAWIAAGLANSGHRPAIVLRGYGADEFLVHKELNPGVPVIATADRATGARQAAAEGCDCVVLDDAFQHRALRRDLDIVLVAAESWRGPMRLLPRGPWRESPRALRRADIAVVTRKAAGHFDAAAVAAELREINPGMIVARAYLEPTVMRDAAGEPHELSVIEGKRVLAVASLADPYAFASQLTRAGADVDLLSYPDHHAFDARDAAAIAERARHRTVVMTRKEAVKLRRLLPKEIDALVLEQRVCIEEGTIEIDAAIAAVL
jgi:tetraacyldisaccharide 4'-kinase